MPNVQGWTGIPRDSGYNSSDGRPNGVPSLKPQQVPDSILNNYTKQLMSSGRTDKEIVNDLEAYYNQLCTNCDQEILRLREELELA